jgi:hypothetical protein
MKTETPIYRRRKPGLGHYHATRSQWHEAWRAARIQQREGVKPDPKHSGIRWAASLIVAYGRHDYMDPLALPAPTRLEALRVVREILDKTTP